MSLNDDKFYIVWQACLQLGRCDEIAEYINISRDGILHALNEGRNLESYIEKGPEVDRCPKVG